MWRWQELSAVDPQLIATRKQTHWQHLLCQHAVELAAFLCARLRILMLPSQRRGGSSCAVLGGSGYWLVCQGVLIPLSFAVECLVCKSVSDTYDTFLDLALEIWVLQRAGDPLLLVSWGRHLGRERGCRLARLPVH